MSSPKLKKSKLRITTDTVSFRIDSILRANLEEEAKKNRTSLNTLVSQILSRYADWWRYAGRLGLIPDSTHNTGTTASATVTVTSTSKDNTFISVGNVSCNIALGASSCTTSVAATVTDTTKSTNTPTGTVTFTLTAGTTGGSLSANTCLLSAGSCSVMFTGTTAGTGSITASYGGDTTHNTSTSAAATVTVTAAAKDSTSTSVVCSPSTIVPTGTFTLTPGTTGGSLSATTCTLFFNGCSVTFTGTSAGSGSVTAAYGGDATHDTSTSAPATITVTVAAKDNTSTSVPNVSCTIA